MPRRPTTEEILLWRSWMGEADPTDTTAADMPVPSVLSPVEPVRTPPPRAPRILRPEPASGPRVSVDLARPLLDSLSPNPPGLDRNTARRLKRGKIIPDRRLDLHGMTAANAHAALTRFLQSAQAEGLRCVLVITGKGGRSEDDHHRPWHAQGHGVLRSNVPRWLQEPHLRRLVVGVFESHIGHGGGGALYVYLRRSR